MGLDWKSISSGLVGGVILTSVLGIGTLLLNGLEDGWVIRHLGGAREANVQTLKTDLQSLQKKEDDLEKQLASRGKALVYTAVRFGELGRSGKDEGGKDLDEGSAFVERDNGARFAQSKYFPICFVSHISITTEGACEIEQAGDWWVVNVKGKAACKFTCFKAQSAEN
jgi:hypothetical protein